MRTEINNEQKLNEKVTNNTNVFTEEAHTINPVTYFFISLLKGLWGVVKWLLDLVLSMVLSLAEFFKSVGIGAYKVVVGIVDFFKRKAHQFKYNDKAGRLSFVAFGASSFSHNQYVNGFLYAVFEVLYIVFFFIKGIPAIAKLEHLGTVTPGEDPNCPPDEMFCEWVDGDNSIMILIFGLLWILSIFLFIYIWNRSISTGYFNYRVDNYLKFETLDKKNVPMSIKLDKDARVAFENGVSLRKLKKSKKEEIDEYLETVPEEERDYSKYLINGTLNHSYKHLKALKKQEAKLEKLKAKRAVVEQSRAEGLDKVLADREKQIAEHPGCGREFVEKLDIKVEVYKNKTLSVLSELDKKIRSQTHVIYELIKRYSSYVEMQHTRNNDKYGKYNNYYKYVAEVDTNLVFYTNYDKFVETYNAALTKSEQKNKENAEYAVELFNLMNSKIEATKQKFAEIKKVRTDLEQELENIKEDYKLEVSQIKEGNAENKEILLYEAKAKLIDSTTILMRKINDLPSKKNVELLEKEEIKESKAAYARDKKYLKTNYTDVQYAKEEVINLMVVEYRIEYNKATEFVDKMFVVEKDTKQRRLLTNNEVEEKVKELKEDKANYMSAHPMKYAPKAQTFVETVKGLFNENFHITILALPIFGIVFISIVPLLFSVLVAFTDYSRGHIPPTQLFTWVGLDNFKTLFFPEETSIYAVLPSALKRTIGWTLTWALIATFSNYILGIVVALMINKDGIKLKKLWRTVFILTIAIPQFISLLSIGTLLKDSGAVGKLITENFGFRLGFGSDSTDQGILLAKIVIIIVNIWVGIPYTILSTTGILLNIPKDLYESAKVDGAGTFTQFTKITMPYILFVTGPYLITQFIGNINNFNVIFFLTGGGPSLSGSALLGLGHTDLLITFLYKIVTSTNNPQFGIASAIGIVIFIICSFISIVMYNKSGSIKEEDQFQ